MDNNTVSEPFTVIMRPVKRYGILQLAPGQSPTGYGKRIATDRMVRFDGESTTYRVYCCCYSNSGSLYIVRRGRTLWIPCYYLESSREELEGFIRSNREHAEQLKASHAKQEAEMALLRQGIDPNKA